MYATKTLLFNKSPEYFCCLFFYKGLWALHISSMGRSLSFFGSWPSRRSTYSQGKNHYQYFCLNYVGSRKIKTDDHLLAYLLSSYDTSMKLFCVSILCVCFFLALPQLGPGPWVLDTSSPGSTDWAGLSAGSLVKSGWSAAREPDPTEGHIQGTDMLLILSTLVTCYVFMWLRIFSLLNHLWFCSSKAANTVL